MSQTQKDLIGKTEDEILLQEKLDWEAQQQMDQLQWENQQYD